jgi:hypothetical protein
MAEPIILASASAARALLSGRIAFSIEPAHIERPDQKRTREAGRRR